MQRLANRRVAGHRWRVAGPALLSIGLLAGCGGGGGSGSADTTSGVGGQVNAPTMSAAAQLGQKIFADTSLSEPAGMSCATCHDPAKGHATNRLVEPGVVPGHFGFRNAPSLDYLRFSPNFGYTDDGPTGGFFRDGRAPTFTAQAQQPFLNADEMANPDVASVISKLAASSYAAEFKAVWGNDVFSNVQNAYDKLGLSVAAYEKEDSDFSSFTSKFDYWRAGKAQLSDRELQGYALFNDPQKGNCAACHPSTGPDTKTPPLFTDFTFDNLGLPRNPAIPANADPAFFDLGLCGPSRTDISDRTLCGAFKVPTLRNIALTAPYFHNGAFNTLRDAVRFYVTRDTNPALWYPTVDGVVQKFDDLPSEYHGNVNTTEVPYNRKPGEQPALNDDEIDLVVEFLNTLTDGYQP